MTLTAKQAWAIGHLVHELRPEWEAEGVVAALKRCAGGDPFATALASIRAAADKNARTPGVIPTPGTHWQEGLKRDPEPARPPRKSEDCPKHPGNWRDSCHGCAADKLAGDDTNYNPRRTEAGDRIATLRGLVSSTKARLCPCGVEPMLCADHDPRKTKPQEDA